MFWPLKYTELDKDFIHFLPSLILSSLPGRISVVSKENSGISIPILTFHHCKIIDYDGSLLQPNHFSFYFSKDCVKCTEFSFVVWR